jgi:hypothetical protein
MRNEIPAAASEMMMADFPNHRPPCERLRHRLLAGHVAFGLAVAAYLAVMMVRLALVLV